MIIRPEKRDFYGKSLEIGDLVELYDWGAERKSLGIVELVWDVDEGRVSCFPLIIEDAYDFWTKALPCCVKIN